MDDLQGYYLSRYLQAASDKVGMGQEFESAVNGALHDQAFTTDTGGQDECLRCGHVVP